MMKQTLLVALLAAASLTAGGAELTLTDAVKAGNRDAVRAMLATPAGKSAVKTTEADGTTPLHWAARAEDLETARLLVGAGADVNAANRYGVTPLSLAAKMASGQMVRLLLEAGANPNATIRDGETILMAAARSGNPEAVKLLLDRGADVNSRTSDLAWTKDRFGLEGVLTILPHGRWTPLMYAA